MSENEIFLQTSFTKEEAMKTIYDLSKGLDNQEEFDIGQKHAYYIALEILSKITETKENNDTLKRTGKSIENYNNAETIDTAFNYIVKALKTKYTDWSEEN